MAEGQTVIVLLSGGTPVQAFSSVQAMRAFLRARGPLAGRMYTRKEIPFDSK